MISSPFIPDASAQLLTALKTEDDSWPGDLDAALSALPAGHVFEVPEVTFRKITDAEREDWQERFAGTR